MMKQMLHIQGDTRESDG